MPAAAAAQSKPVEADSQRCYGHMNVTCTTYRSLLLCMPTMPLPCQPTS